MLFLTKKHALVFLFVTIEPEITWVPPENPVFCLLQHSEKATEKQSAKHFPVFNAARFFIR